MRAVKDSHKLYDGSRTSPGADLLHKAFNDLASSRSSWRAADKACGGTRSTGRSPDQAKIYSHAKSANLSPEQRISLYLARLEAVLFRVGTDGEVAHFRLQQKLINRAVINLSNEELVTKIAYGLYLSEKRVGFQRGQGADIQDINFDEVCDSYVKLVSEKQALQISSLSRWMSYLLTNDGQYPAWFRYLAVRGVLKMGEFDQDTPKFARRSANTVAPFPELNSEALGLVFKMLSDPFGSVVQHVVTQHESLTMPLRQAIASKSFASLYALALVATTESIDRSRLEGEWRKYGQGSDPRILESELVGKGTGWCTATGSAQQHLEAGDFYVFYTKDCDEQYSIPRVAIRMENGEISEIRGIAPEQGLEPEFLDVVEEKGKTLPGYQNFQKKSADMRRLTEMDRRSFVRDAEGKIVNVLTQNSAISAEDLRFLYQVDSPISSFGYEADPRIEEILKNRPDRRRDFATVYGVKLERVAERKEEITSNTLIYVGDLGPNDYEILNQRSEPLIFAGNINFEGSKNLTKIPQGSVFHRPANFCFIRSLSSISASVEFHADAYFSYSSVTRISSNVEFRKAAVFSHSQHLTDISEGVEFYETPHLDGCSSLSRIGKGVVFHSADMKFLEGLDKRCFERDSAGSIQKHLVPHPPLSIEDLRYLYQIEGYTNISDPRLKEIRASRTDRRRDFAAMYGLDREQVADAKELITSQTRLFIGNLGSEDYGIFNQRQDPLIIVGTVDFTNSPGLTRIPSGIEITGDAIFKGCTSLTIVEEGAKFQSGAEIIDCPSLREIEKCVVFENDTAIWNCESLMTIGEGVEFKGSLSIYDCRNLRSTAKE